MAKLFILENNEKGAAILIALMAIAALSIIGVSAIDTSVNEMQIVRNEKVYSLNFYRAESINQRGMQLLIESNPDKILNLQPATSPLVYLQDSAVNDTPATDMTSPANWIVGTNCVGRRTSDGTFPFSNPDPDGNPATDDNEEKFAVLYDGIADGGSLSMSGSSNMHTYMVYGLSQSNTGQVLIETGYRAEF